MAEPWPVDNEIKDLKKCNIQQNFPQLSPEPIQIEKPIEEKKIEEPTEPIAPLKPTLSLEEQFPSLGTPTISTYSSTTEEKGPYRKGKDSRKKKKIQLDITS